MLHVNVSRKTCFLLFLFSFSIPLNASADTCLTGSEAGRFRVYEKEIDYQNGYSQADHRKLSSLFKQSLSPAGGRDSMLADAQAEKLLHPYQLAADRKSLATSGPESVESIFVNGLADFIETRARAELRLWITRFLSREICEKSGAGGFFPNTCKLEIHDSDSVFGIEQQYLALVTALREDFEYLPACIVRQENGTDFGYLLHSVFEGYSNGGNLDNLLYGLAVKLETHPPENEFEELFAFAVLVYASAAEVRPVWDADRKAAVGKFLVRLSAKVARSGNSAYERYLKALARDIANIEPRLQEYYQLRRSILDITKQIRQAGGREEVAGLFIRNGDLLFDQLMVLLRADGLKDEVGRLRRGDEIVRALYVSYQSIGVHEYTRTYLALKPMLDRAYEKTKDEERKKQLKALDDFSGALVSLAEAKSADDFSDRLDSLASPPGAWRLKNQARMYSVTALPGLRYSRDEYTSPGLSGAYEEEYLNVGAPLGVQASWPLSAGGNVGVMVSLLDLGNIIDAPKDTETPGGRITGDIDSSFSNVFTPGIYVSVTPFKNTPLNLVLGYSEGPSSGYRTLVADNGEESPVERDSMISVSLSVDVTLFMF